MKKSLLFILASLFAVFAFTGCADDTAKDETTTPTVTPIDLNNPKTLEGTYDIKYFGTVADKNSGVLSVISTDCDKLKKSALGKKYESSMSMCTENTTARILGGKVTIKVDETQKMVTVVSKLQLMAKYFSEGLGNMGKDDTYQYTKYTAVSFSEITKDGINVNEKILGVSGRNLTSNTSNPKTTFTIKKQGTNGIFIDMTLMDKQVPVFGTLNAPTNVEAIKVSNTAETLDPNRLFVTADQLQDPKEKEIVAGFISDPK